MVSNVFGRIGQLVRCHISIYRVCCFNMWAAGPVGFCRVAVSRVLLRQDGSLSQSSLVLTSLCQSSPVLSANHLTFSLPIVSGVLSQSSPVLTSLVIRLQFAMESVRRCSLNWCNRGCWLEITCMWWRIRDQAMGDAMGRLTTEDAKRWCCIYRYLIVMLILGWSCIICEVYFFSFCLVWGIRVRAVKSVFIADNYWWH